MSGVTAALRDGIIAAQARQFDRARTLLEQAAAETPGDPVVWFWLAISAQSAGAALPSLRRVLELDPSHEKARTALTRLLQSEANQLAASGARVEGRACAAEAAQLAPGVQAVWLTLAALTDDQKERLDALRKALAITPDDSQLRTRVRQALLARGVMVSNDRDEARACFREAAALDADDPRVWQALAKLADTPAEAVNALRELCRVTPDDKSAQLSLGSALAADARALAADQRVNEAYGRWHESIALTGGDVESWLGVADTTSDQDEAARAAETAYKLNSSDERAIAAMRRLNASKIDPSKVAAPVDAFARFEEADAPSPAMPSDDGGTELDAFLDAFVKVPEPAPAPAVAAAPAPAIEHRAPAPSSTPAATPVPAPAPVAVAAVAAAAAAPIVPVTPVAPAPPASSAPPAAAAAAPPSAPAAPANGARRTVMVVDDSPTIRKILGLTLERAGYKVVAEPDGESAIERLMQCVPDLILLDIAMPKIDGYEVCKRIKQDPRTASVPVVMLSGKGAMFDKVKGHMAGANEYLTKPFETPAVLAVVTNYCEQAAGAAING